MSLADLRQEYSRESLSERDVDANPIRQFDRWFAQAKNAGLVEPNAMALATSTSDGRPSVRMVLLKGADAAGFVFFTDYRSRKGLELTDNPRAALCMWWDVLQRQVRIEGTIERISPAESLTYFSTRPYGSQVGAWASLQSSVLIARDLLEREVAKYFEKYPEGTEVPLPHHWGGYRLTPESIEFWQGRPSRLHDRIVYSRAGDAWTIGRLSP
ncbi:pyridoxine/pyridoxamine 5'-phosphate oxidase [Gemmatimonadota bacterium]|nr:pyridoxine/pyridoxamine 5'-phosphate oxidase [Gemmatimonadota bacterium]